MEGLKLCFKLASRKLLLSESYFIMNIQVGIVNLLIVGFFLYLSR